MYLCRLPKNNELKARWIDEISKYQSVEPTGFMICEKHFSQDSFTLKRRNAGGTRGILKDDSIPSIFPIMPERNPENPEDHLERPEAIKTNYIANEIEPIEATLRIQTVKFEGQISGCWNTCNIKYCCNALETNNSKTLSFR